MKFKGIIEYIFRVGIFLLLNRQYMYAISVNFALLLSDYLPKNFDNFADGIAILFFVWLVYMYLSAKLSGIFKKLDNLHFLTGFLIIFIVNLVLNFSFMFNVQIIPFKISFHKTDEFWWFYLIFFIVYRTLNFLSKKFPLCAKIGYYFSFEFYKSLFRKAKKVD